MIAIRFDGPPGPKGGRFVEVEKDGKGIDFGEWKQDGDDWLLELVEVSQLESALIEAFREFPYEDESGVKKISLSSFGKIKLLLMKLGGK